MHTIVLTDAELNVIAGALGKLPYEVSASTIGSIQKQLQEKERLAAAERAKQAQQSVDDAVELAKFRGAKGKK